MYLLTVLCYLDNGDAGKPIIELGNSQSQQHNQNIKFSLIEKLFSTLS